MPTAEALTSTSQNSVWCQEVLPAPSLNEGQALGLKRKKSVRTRFGSEAGRALPTVGGWETAELSEDGGAGP